MLKPDALLPGAKSTLRGAKAALPCRMALYLFLFIALLAIAFRTGDRANIFVVLFVAPLFHVPGVHSNRVWGACKRDVAGDIAFHAVATFKAN